MSVVQVRYVRKAIEDRFGDLIDLSDLSRLSEGNRHERFLTRGLAALAAEIRHPRSDAIAARAVFDGHDDRGLDAVAVANGSFQPRIYLIQAKWSERGMASFGEADVLKMIEGLDLIFELEFSRFNRRFQQHVPDVEKALKNSSGTLKVTLVLALLRTEPVSDGVIDLLKKKIVQYNQVVEMVDYDILNLRDFHRAVVGDAAAPRIDIRVRLEGFGQETDPYRAMYGTMIAPEVADLFGNYGRGLFARNIRDALDLTDVNAKIRNTLLDQPEHFWYFSNGIIMLCDSIKPVGRAVPGGVAEFQINGASVVNGAQTVSAIHKAYTTDPETAQRGRVMVRLISLEDCPPAFGDQVTTSTNTQNPIEDRDFKSIDSVQIKLRDDFAHALSLSYVIKRGEPLPAPKHGCSITEAGEALAATHRNAEFAALAKRDLSALWQDDKYQALFGSTPDPYGVWRRVQTLRAVRARLAELIEGLFGRGAATALYGDLLITHVVFQQLDTKAINDPDTDWDAHLVDVPLLVESALAWSLQAIDVEYGPKSQIIAAVRNTERIQRVARSAIRGMASGQPAPELRAEYQISTIERKGRQIDAVKTLVTAERIPDGTVLEFRPVSRPERNEMTAWLAQNEKRSLAVWRNNTKRPLKWLADMQWYSPSGLVRMMRRMASGKDVPIQGTLHWHVPDAGSLKDLAENARAEQDLIVEDEPADLDS